MSNPAKKLRQLLAQDRCNIMPCCYDGLTAKMIEQAGFDLTFMSGFAVSAARLGVITSYSIHYTKLYD